MGDTVVGCDVGGTFTDVVAVTVEDATVRSVKVLNDATDSAASVLRGIRLVAGDGSNGTVSAVVHATTLVSNLVLERKGGRVALVTTAGFRDVLRLARGNRPLAYRADVGRPEPLVAPELCFEVTERTGPDGEVLHAPGDDELGALCAALRAARVESVAVVLLHSYANPRNEARIAEAIASELPEVYLATSSEIAPEIREYERASTTVLAAYAGPRVSDYVARLGGALRQDGFTGSLMIMQSNGGTISARQAIENPVRLLESGPSAGVLGAAALANLAGIRDVITLDMGGTTAKAGLVRDGKPTVVPSLTVGSGVIAGSSHARGFPVRVPSIELAEVGAGGGSIVWVDAGGAMRVGPDSAGASPGPACYGIGGTLATITDADLLLGWLGVDGLANSSLSLDRRASEDAFEREICARLRTSSPTRAAWGAVEIAAEHMANAIKLMTVERGIDPARFTLVAFGGAGPVHAARVAQLLAIPTVVVPPCSGVAASLGLVMTTPQLDKMRTHKTRLTDESWDDVVSVAMELQDDAVDALTKEGLQSADDPPARADVALDMRYVGQSYELTLPVSMTATPRQVAEDFSSAHRRRFGHGRDGEIEIVTIRVSVTVQGRGFAAASLDFEFSADERSDSTRWAVFDPSGEPEEVPVLARAGLSSRGATSGPCLITEEGTTTVVPRGFTAELHLSGDLVLRCGSQDGRA